MDAVTRDYRAEMAELLSLKVPESEYVPAVIAAEVFDYLTDHDADLLDGWLHSMAPALLTDVIGQRARSERARATRQSPAVAFGAAAKSAAAGDPEPLSAFRVTCVVSVDNMRRAIGDMTRDDHLFVASSYRSTANAARLESAFHGAIAKRLTSGQRTSDVMDEETYVRLRASIAGRPE